MTRALIPCSAIAGLSWVGWQWFERELPHLAVKSLIRLAEPRWLVGTDPIGLSDSWPNTLWTWGGALILLHSWREVIWVVKALLGLVYWFLHICGISIEFLARHWQWFLRDYCRCFSCPNQVTSTDQEVLFTWRLMAGAAGVVPLPPGTFVLVSRPPEWDEVMMMGFSDDGSVSLCRTTSPDGGSWIWCLVQVNGLHMRISQPRAVVLPKV